MKKLSLTFIGDVHVASYGVFLDGESLESAIGSALIDGDNDEVRCVARVNLTFEPVKDAGLSVEVNEV